MPRRPAVQAGERYADWTVLQEGTKRGRKNGRYYLCRCVCGAEREVIGLSLRAGTSKSCGCSRDKAGHLGHNTVEYRSPTYRSWLSMKNRCLNRNSERWSDYGGRGIGVCDRWQGERGFANFLADMGERPAGKTIDRIDNEGSYEPSNCRWATVKEQAQNKRPPRQRRAVAA